MKKILMIILIGCCFTNSYAVSKVTQNHYDQADVGYRTYGANFKDYALASCLQKAFGSHDTRFNEDAKATTGAYLELWMDYDFEKPNKTQGKLETLIQKYLNQSYGSQMYPKSKVYIMKCFDFYHSYDLDKLSKELVIHSNRTYKQDHPKYPHEW